MTADEASSQHRSWQAVIGLGAAPLVVNPTIFRDTVHQFVDQHCQFSWEAAGAGRRPS